MSSEERWTRELESAIKAADMAVHLADKKSLLDIDRLATASSLPPDVKGAAKAAAEAEDMIVGKNVNITVGQPQAQTSEPSYQPQPEPATSQPEKKPSVLGKIARYAAIGAAMAGAGGAGAVATKAYLDRAAPEAEVKQQAIESAQPIAPEWGKIRVNVIPGRREAGGEE